jgi:hypothetical protein
MASFDAGTVGERLEWTFVPDVKAHGTLTEPDDRQIAEFIAGIRKLMNDAQVKGMAELGENPDPADVMGAINALDVDDLVKSLHDMAALYSALCSYSPTTDQILGLPMRKRAAFYAWIQKEVVSPEAGTGAGNAVVKTLPRAAAG